LNQGFARRKCLLQNESGFQLWTLHLMKYGYARVSTDDQSPALQLAALKKAGCKTMLKDEGSCTLSFPRRDP